MKTESGNILNPTPKQEINRKIIENIRKTGQNKICFDCGDKVYIYSI